ncbi:MAG: hypothetical protein Q7S12_04810 [bacterium]|nr:hypothetical protein [bacterium]
MANGEKPNESIGSGNEKTVYPDPENKDRVFAKFHEYIKETPKQIKARYYLTKIIHFLLPKNIPDMHWVGSEPNAYQIDKVEVDERHRAIREYYEMPDSSKTEAYKKAVETISLDKDIEDFQLKIDQLGIRSLDLALINYTKDKEGNVLYLDSFYAWKFKNDGSPSLFLNFKKLEEAINSLAENDKKSAKNFLQRLRELYEEEKELSKNKKSDERK